ncbi:MAG: helix-turn-helix domain-containing protein [Siculibacillus sp.]
MSAAEQGRRPTDGFDPQMAETLSARAGNFCSATRSARVSDGLTLAELVIYLAVGHLGVDTSSRIPRLTPKTYLEIAEYLAIPRETVRRKAGRLVDRGLLQLGPGGVVVRDMEAWLARATALLGGSTDTV